MAASGTARGGPGAWRQRFSRVPWRAERIPSAPGRRCPGHTGWAGWRSRRPPRSCRRSTARAHRLRSRCPRPVPAARPVRARHHADANKHDVGAHLGAIGQFDAGHLAAGAGQPSDLRIQHHVGAAALMCGTEVLAGLLGTARPTSRGAASRTVTRFPAARAPAATSSPMKPPPITTTSRAARQVRSQPRGVGGIAQIVHAVQLRALQRQPPTAAPVAKASREKRKVRPPAEVASTAVVVPFEAGQSAHR